MPEREFVRLRVVLLKISQMFNTEYILAHLFGNSDGVLSSVERMDLSFPLKKKSAQARRSARSDSCLAMVGLRVNAGIPDVKNRPFMADGALQKSRTAQTHRGKRSAGHIGVIELRAALGAFEVG